MEANLEKIKKLSCDQLIAVLQDGELEPRIIDVLRSQNIAGRHIAKVKRDDLVRMLGLSLGDYFDFEDALEQGLTFGSNSPNENNDNPNGSNNDNPNGNKNDDPNGNNDEPNPANPANSGNDHPLPVSPSNSNLSSLSSPNLETNSDADLDAVLLNFGSKETIKEMNSYHKHVAKTQIDKFNFLTSKGLPCKRPSLLSNISPSPAKRITLSCSGSASTSKDTTTNPISVKRKIPSLFGRASTSKDTTMNNPASSVDEDIGTTSTMNLRSSTGVGRSSMAKDAKSNEPSTSASSSSATKGSVTSNPVVSKPSSSRKCPKQAIMEEHTAFLNADNLGDTHKALIKHYLQSPVNYMYCISEILGSLEEVTDEWMLLQRDGVVFGKVLEKVLRFLVQHLYSLVPNPNLVSPEMRESIAVCLVATFPKFGQLPSRNDEKPWSWLYNRETNTGKIANIVQNRQRVQKQTRLRGGGTERRKRSKSAANPAPVPPPPSNHIADGDLSNDAKFLKLLAANDSNKADIIDKMESTFQERRSFVANNKYTVSALLKAFIHLRSFKGEMVELEFRKIHGGKENQLLLHFPEIALKLVALARREGKYQDCFAFSDDHLNALLVLKKFLPKAVRCYEYENLMDPAGQLSELIEVIPVGSNVQNSIETRRQHAKGRIQPYLLAVGAKDKLESIFIILGDSMFIQLPKNTQPIRAVDLLIKVHFVINTNYYLGWKNVYRFITAHVYNLPPENKRLSVFTDKWLQICSMRLD